MANLAMKLDTLSYSKKLIEAGCEPKLAEAHASLQQDVWIEVSEDYLSQFATKQDLDAHRIATKHDLAILEQKIEKKMVSLALKMTTILGGLVVAGVIVLAAIIKL